MGEKSNTEGGERCRGCSFSFDSFNACSIIRFSSSRLFELLVFDDWRDCEPTFTIHERIIKWKSKSQFLLPVEEFLSHRNFVPVHSIQTKIYLIKLLQSVPLFQLNLNVDDLVDRALIHIFSNHVLEDDLRIHYNPKYCWMKQRISDGLDWMILRTKRVVSLDFCDFISLKYKPVAQVMNEIVAKM